MEFRRHRELSLPVLDSLAEPETGATGADAARHLLILGTPRSGSTLLASMIGRHSEIGMLIEDPGWAISSLVSKRIAGNKLCVPNQISEVRAKPSLAERLRRRLGPTRARSQSDYSIADYLKLPGIRIIAIVRGPEPVISSIMKRGRQPSEVAAHRWRRGTEILSGVARYAGLRALVVSYDRLVTEPEREMKRVALFLGVEFEPEMLEGYKYNPIYPGEQEIDASRAEEAGSVESKWTARFPQATRCYEELVRQSGQDSGSELSSAPARTP